MSRLNSAEPQLGGTRSKQSHQGLLFLDELPRSPPFSKVYISNFRPIFNSTLLVFVSLTHSLSVSLPSFIRPHPLSRFFMPSTHPSCCFLLLCSAHLSGSSFHLVTKANCSTFSRIETFISLPSLSVISFIYFDFTLHCFFVLFQIPLPLITSMYRPHFCFPFLPLSFHF